MNNNTPLFELKYGAVNMSSVRIMLGSLYISAVVFAPQLSFADGLPDGTQQSGYGTDMRASLSGAGNRSGESDSERHRVESAKGERLATSMGHYARSRSLLIEAIKEFDRGRKLARPDSLIDAGEWRASVVGRARDLEVVLDPQPRATKSGAKYGADNRLLNLSGK